MVYAKHRTKNTSIMYSTISMKVRKETPMKSPIKPPIFEMRSKIPIFAICVISSVEKSLT
jgi:hypothetical protein